MDQALDLRAVKAAAEKAGSQEKESVKLIPREITISIQYRDPDTGEIRQANVTSRVMKGEQRATVARMEATLAGVPWDRLPVLQQGRFHALSVCSCQLIDSPDWLLQALSEDDVLLGRIFSELEAHDRRFFRRNAEPGESGESIEGMVISSVLRD